MATLVLPGHEVGVVVLAADFEQVRVVRDEHRGDARLPHRHRDRVLPDLDRAPRPPEEVHCAAEDVVTSRHARQRPRVMSLEAHRPRRETVEVGRRGTPASVRTKHVPVQRIQQHNDGVLGTCGSVGIHIRVSGRSIRVEPAEMVAGLTAQLRRALHGGANRTGGDRRPTPTAPSSAFRTLGFAAGRPLTRAAPSRVARRPQEWFANRVTEQATAAKRRGEPEGIAGYVSPYPYLDLLQDKMEERLARRVPASGRFCGFCYGRLRQEEAGCPFCGPPPRPGRP